MYAVSLPILVIEGLRALRMELGPRRKVQFEGHCYLPLEQTHCRRSDLMGVYTLTMGLSRQRDLLLLCSSWRYATWSRPGPRIARAAYPLRSPKSRLSSRVRDRISGKDRGCAGRALARESA